MDSDSWGAEQESRQSSLVGCVVNHSRRPMPWVSNLSQTTILQPIDFVSISCSDGDTAEQEEGACHRESLPDTPGQDAAGGV
mmetsp:Transcript_31426/g.83685  ORF Transcript_31426/g.83685 Transcript_31426/m.83685 type:complete len:82 (+) Transcript_31426:493-738(+)